MDTPRRGIFLGLGRTLSPSCRRILWPMCIYKARSLNSGFGFTFSCLLIRFQDYFCASLTIARIPAFTGLGRLSQALTTCARSSGIGGPFWYTPGTPFGCKEYALFCSDTVDFCFWAVCGEVDNVLFCMDFAQFCVGFVPVGDSGN